MTLDDIPRGLHPPLRVMLALQKVLLVSASLAMAIVFFVVVILRYGFEGDLFAYEEWVLMIAFWLYFIGGAQGSFDNTHIKADFMAAMVSSAHKRWLLANLTLALELLALVVMCWWGLEMVLEDVAEYPNWPKTVAWKIPFVVPRFGIFLGFVLMAVYTALHLYVSVRRGPVERQEV